MSVAGSHTLGDQVDLWREQWNNGTMFQFQTHRPHPKLVEHYDRYIKGRSRAKIFFPLCGESYDMSVLAEKGHEIVGVDCSDVALKTFISKHNISCSTERCVKTNGTLYQNEDRNCRLYCCDIFNFSVDVEGQFDAIVDFGSMGALLRTELPAYAALMKTLMKPDTHIILESYVYNVNKYPDCQPVCLTVEYLEKLFGEDYCIEKIDEGPDPYTSDDGGAIYSQEQNKDQVVYGLPQITGTAYFLIKPTLRKQCADS